MEKNSQSLKNSQGLIKRLLISISQTTQYMSTSFQETILRHEQQFIKCYRMKIAELVRLFDQLKATIQDKFINNTLTVQLDNVIKQRDYFKYQSLKLNSQYQALNDDYKNLIAQANNSTQQISIYRHLLQNQKLKYSETQTTLLNLKRDLNQISLKSVIQTKQIHEVQNVQLEKQYIRLKKQIKEKNQIIRALKERVTDFQRNILFQHDQKIQKKELYQLFKACVNGWKRQLSLKQSKEQKKINTPEQLSLLTKKQILKIFFSHTEFLKFLQKLLFDDGFKVVFQSTQEKYMQKNRVKLMNYLTKKNFYQTKGIRF